MEKVVLQKEEIERLLAESYPRVWKEKITKIEKIKGNEKNSHNYIVYTEKKKYLARRHLALTKENAEIVLRIIIFCLKQGIKVPVVIENCRKELVTQKNDDHFTVFEFIDGNEFSGSAQQIKAVAREVARLHQVLRTYRGVLPRLENSVYEEGGYANLTEKEMELVSKDLPAEDIFFIKKEMEELNKRRIMVKTDSIVMQPIHRDLHPKNILFNGDEIAAILDFDAIKKGARIVDVGFCGFRFAGKNILQFMEEYNLVNHLTIEEEKAVLFAVREEFLRRINYILHDLLKGKKTWFPSLNSHLESIKTLREIENRQSERSSTRLINDKMLF